MSIKYLSIWLQPIFNLNSVHDDLKQSTLKIPGIQKKRNLIATLFCNMPCSHHDLSQYTENWWVHWQAAKILPYHSSSYLVVIINNLYWNHGLTTNKSMQISKQLCSFCVLFHERGEKEREERGKMKRKKKKGKENIVKDGRNWLTDL